MSNVTVIGTMVSLNVPRIPAHHRRCGCRIPLVSLSLFAIRSPESRKTLTPIRRFPRLRDRHIDSLSGMFRSASAFPDVLAATGPRLAHPEVSEHRHRGDEWS